MVRTHLSAKPITRLRTVAPHKGETGAYKPAGIWYEVDGDWQRWCDSENFGHKPEEVFIYRIELDGPRVLAIRNVAEFDAFHREYAALRDGNRWTKQVDWQRLADEGWDGLEIAPYQWERRLGSDTSWYYGWDCASGVLWNPRATRLVLERAPIVAADSRSVSDG